MFSTSRRKFLKQSAGSLIAFQGLAGVHDLCVQPPDGMDLSKSIIGNYGPWAAARMPEPARLSFRQEHWKDLAAWKKTAQQKTTELLAAPELPSLPEVKKERTYVYDGLHVEELSWQLPYGRPTQAVLLKPVGASGPLPGILALHDHGGKKYFGYRKIVKTSDTQHPMLIEHRESDYGGKAWANEMARRGYVVLVHDAFAFGSRRVYYEDVDGISWGQLNTQGKSDENPEDPAHITAYNTWASEHENVMSKSLFAAGTTWPGVFLSEDRTALSVLAARNDVIAGKIGCGGLSGGGLRTAYLAGLDARIQCAVCVGFMSTWKDFILYKSFTHTWMTYIPVLPSFLDFPEIFGLRAPLPAMVLNNNQDELYTLEEMKRADAMLREVYAKAGAAGHYKSGFYDGPHKFDQPMQQEAFAWFDQWLKG